MKRNITAFTILLIWVFNLTATEQRLRIGLTLSGGGARGIAHVGVLKVLEEAGIDVDLITGTSMGSIVGGLYAIGYTASELEEIILSQDWDEILMDEISLHSISMEEKDDRGKYVGSFPIEKGRITLPKGLVAGQQVQALISKLCLSVHHIEDFSKLPIPFQCIGTDIETGEVVILKDGFLPDAIRASMSIPSLFAPIEIEGQLLVDGGLVRNFPVSDVLGMGADFVIGVDVGTPLYTKRELNSLVRIMNQAVAFQGVESTLQERELCDILILPAVDDYSIMDFRKSEELIALGEESARKILPELLQLKANLDKLNRPAKPIPIKEFEKLFIQKIYVQGLRQVSKNLVLGKLGINRKAWITSVNLTDAIERIYGSGYFEKVSYKLEPKANGVDLYIRVVEKTASNLNFGFHYDSDMESAVLLNATLRNKFIMGSKLSLSLELSENSAHEASYFIHTGWKPGFGFGLSNAGREFSVPIYNGAEKIAIYNYSTSLSNFDLQTIFSNSFTIGGGLEVKYVNLKPDIIIPNMPNAEGEYQLLSYRGYCLVNTYDRITHPRKGVKLTAELRRMFELYNSVADNHDPINIFLMRCTVVDKLIKNIVYEETLYLGTIKGEFVPADSYFYLGGHYEPEQNLIPFVGSEFMSIICTEVAILSSALRWELMNDIFVTAKVNWAYTSDYDGGVVKKEQKHHGYGASLGLMTPIGPVEVTASRGNDNNETLISSSIGFYF